MSAGKQPDSFDALPRAEKLKRIVARLREYLAQGKPVPHQEILRQFPDLLPELEVEVRKALAIEGAQIRAAQLPPEPAATQPLSEPPSGSGAADIPTRQESAQRSGSERTTPAARPRVRYIGDYELLEKIAAGGMGVVWKARQVSLNRTVALKMILAGQLASEQDVIRFHTEAEAAANLDHPNIVQVFEVGQYEGHHYFSMAYVVGRSLEQLARDDALRIRDAVVHLEKVARAIHYAHEQGVLHRDLKPSNILIDANGAPKVTDFGLAKRVNRDSELTRAGQVLGTPSYMPPEQAGGERSDVGPRSDVYSLGATLYRLTAGRAPFVGDSATETLMQVLVKEPVSPRVLVPSIERDLETITLKCLEKDPAKRYASASELADELERFLHGEPIRARPVTQIQRTLKWCRRNPVIATLLTVAAVLLVAVIVVSTTGYAITSAALKAEENARGEESRQRKKAEAAEAAEVERRQQVEAERDKQRRFRYIAEFKAAHAAQTQEQDGQARLILDQLAKEEQSDLRNWEWHWQNRQLNRRPTPIEVRQEFRQVVNARAGVQTAYDFGLAFDVASGPQNDRIAVAERRFVTVFDVAGKDRLFTLDTHDPGVAPDKLRSELLLAVGWSGFTTNLIAAGSDWGTVSVWDCDTKKKIHLLAGHQGVVRGIAWHPRDRKLASAGEDGMLRIWDLADPEKSLLLDHREKLVLNDLEHRNVPSWPARAEFPETAKATRSGGVPWYQITGNADVHVGNARPDGQESPLHGANATVNWSTAVAWNPEGTLAACGCRDGSIRIWETAAQRQVATLHGVGAAVRTVQWHAHLPHLLAVHVHGGAHVWSVPEKRQLQALPALAAAWSSDGNRLVCLTTARVEVHDYRTHKLDQRLDIEMRSSSGKLSDPRRRLLDSVVRWQPDGRRIVVLHRQNVINIEARNWLDTPKTEAGGIVRIIESPDTFLRGHGESVDCLAWQPQSSELASGGADKTVRTWDAAARKESRARIECDAPVLAVSWRPDGKQVAAAADSALLIWDADSGRLSQTIHSTHPAEIDRTGTGKKQRVRFRTETAAWRPGNTEIATSFVGGRLEFVDPNTGNLLRIEELFRMGVYSVAWDDLGKWLLAGGWGKPCLVSCRVDGDESPQPIECAWSRANFVSFNRTGTRFAVAVENHMKESRPNSSGTSYLQLPASRDRSMNAVLVYDAGNRKLLFTMSGHENRVLCLAWSPDGQRLATASADGTVRIWDPTVGVEVLVLEGHGGGVNCVAWSDDGHTLASGGTDGLIKLWDGSPLQAENAPRP